MDSWIWVLIGFTAGLVVFAILYMIFHKDASAELQKAMDEQGAQLSKAETKSAVLQDKLLASESAQEKLRAGQEAEYARMAEEWQARLDAADAGYREKLAVLEKHFSDLDAAFAAQLAAEKEKSIAAASIAAGIAAGMAEGSAEPEDEPTAEFESEDAEGLSGDEMEAGEQLEEGGEGPGTSLDEPYEADEALLAAGVGAGAVLVADEDAGEEVEDAEEGLEPAVAIDEEAAPEDSDWVEEAFGEETSDDAETAVPAVDDETNVWVGPTTRIDDEEEDDDESAGAVAKAALAVGGAAAAAVILSDDEDSEEEAPDEGADDSEVSIIEDDTEPAFEVNGEDEESDADLAAAAVAGGTAAAVLADSGAEEEDTAEEVDPIATSGDEETVGGQEPLEGVMLVAAEDEPGEDAADGPEETAREELEPVETPWPEDTSTWKGEYFNNMKLEGDPVLEREDAEIDFDWGMESPAPEINVDGFSVRWTRTADLPPGLYRFTVTSDDGARLYVNERMVVSAWYDHTEMTFRREMELPGGPVDLRVEYYENAMAAMIKVSWERIG